MASTVSVLVLFSLVLSNILATNGNIQFESNGLCNFGCEIKAVSDKSRFSRDQIFDGNFKVVHFDLKRIEVSNSDLLSLQDAWDILRPFWVKEEYSDEFLRKLASVQFEKYSFKSTKTVFRTNVRLLDTDMYGCNITANVSLECVIRAISYSFLRNVTGGNGFVCYAVLVKGNPRHTCCDLTTGNSVQCKQAAFGSHWWLDVLPLATTNVILCVVIFFLPVALATPFLPYKVEDLSTSDDDDRMVEPDQDVNPITKYIKKQFVVFVGKLTGSSSFKAGGTAVIVLALVTPVSIGTLYAIFFVKNFSFINGNRRCYPVLEAQTELEFQYLYKWLKFMVRSAYDELTPFQIFCLVWFHFCALPVPPLLEITGLSSSDPFRAICKKMATAEPLDLFEPFRLFGDIFINIICFTVRKTKMLRSSQVSPKYLLEFFVRSLACIFSFTALLAFYVFVYTFVAILVLPHLPYLFFMVIFSSVIGCGILTKNHCKLAVQLDKLASSNQQEQQHNSISSLEAPGTCSAPGLHGKEDEGTRFTLVQLVQVAGCLLYVILTISASVFGIMYTFLFSSELLATVFTCSLLGLNVNHSVMLPYMTFYGVVVYLMFFVYSSYVSGYVELRELTFDTCSKIAEENGDDQHIRQVFSRDEKGVMRVSEKLLEHIYNEMNPLKKTVREMMLKMVVFCCLFFLFYQFVIEDEGTETDSRIPPLMQAVLTLSAGVFPKLYDACKTGPADKKNLAHMKKKSRVETIVTAYITTYDQNCFQEVIWV